MRFKIVDQIPSSVGGSSPFAFLVRDNWNDWFKWYTQFTALILSADGMHQLGYIKVGQRGMTEDDGRVKLPDEFSFLDESYFSLGQDENFYETLDSLPDQIKIDFCQTIRDCAYDLSIFDMNSDEAVMLNSLLRDVNVFRVRSKMHSLVHGHAVLTPYEFDYELPPDESSLSPSPTFSFNVVPNSFPPTNIHVLVGRNGVGKSRCFDLLAKSLLNVKTDDASSDYGTLRSRRSNVTNFNQWLDDADEGDARSLFSGLVFVAFSAFDAGGPSKAPASQQTFRFSYVGLKSSLHTKDFASLKDKELATPLKTLEELAGEFVQSVGACRKGARLRRWRRALETLEADPLFQEKSVSSIADNTEDNWRDDARTLFRSLSSGHGIVLLIISRLVELVEERSLVLIDEPEGHLHPPLLAAFVRALSDLLIDRNGVALVATHSPVVLQEVPSSCVWILSRTGHSARADRPDIETFGENSGILTREVFGLEVTQSGYHKLIQDAVEELGDYESVLRKFSGQMGAEARALARALSLIERNRKAG